MFSNNWFIAFDEYIFNKVLPYVRDEFRDFFISFVQGLSVVVEDIQKFIIGTNLLTYAFGISATIFIAKKAFGWFKGMTK